MRAAPILAPLLLTLLAVELLDELVFGARGAALPAIQNDLSLSYAQVGILLALPNIASAVLEPILGVLGDAWSRRAVVFGGGVVYAGGLAGVAASGSFLPLLLAFVVVPGDGRVRQPFASIADGLWTRARASGTWCGGLSPGRSERCSGRRSLARARETAPSCARRQGRAARAAVASRAQVARFARGI